MSSEIQNNMRKLAQYRKIVNKVCTGDDAKRFNDLAREFQLCTADLFEGMNQQLFAELRKDIMTLGVGCISKFEGRFGYLWDNNSEEELSEAQLELLDEWQSLRNEIFDSINIFLYKYQKLLLGAKHGDREP